MPRPKSALDIAARPNSPRAQPSTGPPDNTSPHWKQSSKNRYLQKDAVMHAVVPSSGEQRATIALRPAELRDPGPGVWATANNMCGSMVVGPASGPNFKQDTAAWRGMAHISSVSFVSLSRPRDIEKENGGNRGPGGELLAHDKWGKGECGNERLPDAWVFWSWSIFFFSTVHILQIGVSLSWGQGHGAGKLWWPKPKSRASSVGWKSLIRPVQNLISPAVASHYIL
ncbi:hypothetical protein METBIDRAFT_13084 [Metschnikowia bicuspidata var. bicuspidata NRRL YB-4993]|uniref:Uncharacterized protein n=1 Tax=Metschnikowia bicuspidata var. bicuspidata NRRL YB-4993 TaxID=869754 RepID=A0A1A0H843_9ASCO|nr:hypothetical protein METBIDRAFT_13084 [Metschnikowia bicuspidata var. bicuspidata NRRL YB-4993]OBA20062.1 hypothetical protein METBIDRAFT_13084 [Metschnikowia bicuspidata var. bicuspidata NRRL YB-4993]